MATERAGPALHDAGYRRVILVFAALWGAAPALSFLIEQFGLPTSQAIVAVGAVMTISLGLLYEVDSRALAEHGDGVPLAWAYALVSPISIVFWSLFGPLFTQLPLLGLVGILTGPPASALLYLWQRGKHATGN